MTREARRCPDIIRVNTHHIPLEGRTRFGRTARTFWLKNNAVRGPKSRLSFSFSHTLHPEFCLQDKNGIVVRRRSRSGDDVGTWKTVAWQCRKKKKKIRKLWMFIWRHLSAMFGNNNYETKRHQNKLGLKKIYNKKIKKGGKWGS